MTKKENEILKDSLNERYSIYIQFGERNEDWLYYAGMLNLIERLGLSWQRNDEGKHWVG